MRHIIPIIITLFSLIPLSSVSQNTDSLLLGTWRWHDKADSIVILKRTTKFKRKPASLHVKNTDTMYRSIYSAPFGNTRGKLKYTFVKGPWYFDSTGLFVVKYEHRERYVEERFRVVDREKRKIVLQKVKHIVSGKVED